MTLDWQSVVNDPQVQVVTELVGGTGIAPPWFWQPCAWANRSLPLIRLCFRRMAKSLFARRPEQDGTNLYYEASVCGGIRLSRLCEKASSGIG